MVVAINMPKMGLSGDTSLIGQWLKQKGDQVKVGDPLLTVETDKASFEVEAEADGVLLEIFYDEGDEVQVLTPIGLIGEEGEDYSEFLINNNLNNVGSDKEVKRENIDENIQQQTNQESIVSEQTSQKDGKLLKELKISPRAMRTAQRLKLDYRFAEPSGAEGRIIEKDVLKLLDEVPRLTNTAHASGISGTLDQVVTGLGGRKTLKDITSQEQADSQAYAEENNENGYTVQPLSRTRRLIAKNMMNSLQNSAQLTLTTSFDASEILEYRKKIKKQRSTLDLADISLNDIILFAVSRTLINHKDLNAHLVEDNLLLFNDVHLGMAVDTPRGLIVPTLLATNKKSLVELAEMSREMVQKCKKSTILPDEMQGASFTVTNLGSFGIESFTPVLNPPQVGILGVNTIEYRTKQLRGEYITYPAMGLSLTFDHQALDGAPAAKFLKDLTNSLENFNLLLAK